MGASVASPGRAGESEAILIGGHRRELTVAEAAAAMGVGKTTARRLFDRSRGSAGAVDPASGERLFSPAWVAGQAARRATRADRTVPDTLSIAETADRLHVGASTVRRWFDRDQPDSGQVIEGGRTGSTERRCAVAWVEGLEQALGRVPPTTE